jgi:hypothetical protein
VHLVVIDTLALLGEVARLGERFVQNTRESRHNGVCLD